MRATINRPPRKYKLPQPRRFIAAGIVLVLFAAAVAYRLSHATYHLAAVREGVLYRDGSRSVKELATAVQQTGSRTVISLIDDAEARDPDKPQFAAEANYLLKHGIAYQRIPVTLGGWPTTTDIRIFLHTVVDRKYQPVLIHCAQGVRRTAMFVAAYQESVLGYNREQAKKAIISFGHSQRTIADIERFIDAYDPKTQSVPDLNKTNSPTVEVSEQ